ncbi:hypothetical protein J437_LFUL013722 [Ladona fulva]|uniref:Ciliary microtubule inner protein 2A-C-like domain-containing protein n=1 Tax=Ladona fulva TaxID=123851 RepID=A0A8K0KNY7_LADFU|nr:hypothetical protein J437_LFUL013722 [Ladona fulva]
MSHKKLSLPVPEPHYIPGYTGHCARLQEEIGNNYSMATHRALAHPSSYDISRKTLTETHGANGTKEEESGKLGPGERNITGDTTGCRSYLQQASEFLKSPLCQKFCSKKCSEEEEKCKTNCFKGELKPPKSSFVTKATPTPCSYCLEIVNARPPTFPAMVHKGLDKICNGVNCKFARPDERREVVQDSSCPRFHTQVRRNSTTDQLKEVRNPEKPLQTVCEKYGCPCPCCKLS